MTDLVPVDYDKMFGLAERICKSPLLPDAYRNKPIDAAVAMLYGAEIGLPPMTALNRVVVISGKPTLDAQGMSALIRAAGHSLSGDVTDTSATAFGKRRDTGDEMKVSFSLEDAKRAGLLRQNSPWTKFPGSMCWARAVSQLARELFSDVLMGFSYVPDEMQAVVDEKKDSTVTGLLNDMEVDEPIPAVATVREPPAALKVVPDTGEIIEPAPVPEVDELAELKQGLVEIIGGNMKLRGELTAKFGPSSNLSIDQLREAIAWAAGWMDTEPVEPELNNAPF